MKFDLILHLRFIIPGVHPIFQQIKKATEDIHFGIWAQSRWAGWETHARNAKITFNLLESAIDSA